MGDHANDAVERSLTYEDLYYDYIHGDASHLSDGLLDEFAEYTMQYTVTCKFCGKEALKWRRINGKWRLYGETGAHKCSFTNECRRHISRT